MSDIMLSVVVLTYNQEKYISQTLDSIINQNHDFTYEIVIGEDCSTDSTRKIVEQYEAKYPTIIKVNYNKPNLGLIKNYFEVLKKCSGKYIMECAGDDFWLPGKIEKQIQYLENNLSVGMCYGRAKVYNDVLGIYEKKLFGSRKEQFDDLIINNDIPAPSVCIRSEILKDYLKEIDPINKNWFMEDYPMWLWFSLKSKICFMDDVFCVYRVLDDSACHKKDLEKRLAFQKNYNEVKNYYLTLLDRDLINYDENEEIVYIYYQELLVNYSKKSAIKLQQHYKKIKNKSKKFFMIYLVSKYRILYRIVRGLSK